MARGFQRAARPRMYRQLLGPRNLPKRILISRGPAPARRPHMGPRVGTASRPHLCLGGLRSKLGGSPQPRPPTNPRRPRPPPSTMGPPLRKGTRCPAALSMPSIKCSGLAPLRPLHSMPLVHLLTDLCLSWPTLRLLFLMAAMLHTSSAPCTCTRLPPRALRRRTQVLVWDPLRPDGG